MTIVESIKCVLQQNNDGLTSKQIYDEIIRQGLYSFGAENPVGVVNAQLRRRCIGLDFPTAYPIKFFEIAGYEGKKIKFRLISTENTATIITAPKTTDISELLPEEKIKAALQEHLQNIRQQVFDSVLNNSPEFFEHLVVDLLLKMGYGYAFQIDHGHSSHVRQGDELVQISADGLQLLQHFFQAVDDHHLLSQAAGSDVVAHGHPGLLRQLLDGLPVCGRHAGAEFNIFFHVVSSKS